MQPSAIYSQTVTNPILCPPQEVVGRHLHDTRSQYVTRGATREATETLGRVPLGLAALFGCQENQTSLAQMTIDRHQVVALLNVAAWLNVSFVELQTETTSGYQFHLEQAVVGEYAAVAEVAFIYSDRFRSEYVFTIFIRGEQYNDALMDTLLDHELRLVKRFAPLPLSFHYLPYVPGAVRRELVRQAARLIFEG